MRKYLGKIMHGAMLGIIIGFCISIYSKGIDLFTSIRSSIGIYVLFGLPLALMLITWLFEKYGSDCKKGIGLIFELEQNKNDDIPSRLPLLMTISAWIGHLIGASCGKAGVALQIGGVIGSKLGKDQESKINYMIAGLSSALSGLFGIPLTGIFFGLEMLVYGTLQIRALIYVVSASICSYLITYLFGIRKTNIHIVETIDISFILIIKLILIGILCGLIGSAFAYLMKYAKKYLPKMIKGTYLRCLIYGIFLMIIMLMTDFRYSGTGINLIQNCFDGQIINWYDFILKLVLTIFTLSIGFQGGEITPLLSIGATFGYFLASIFGLPLTFVCALCYAACLASGTNTLIAPMMIGCEIFGFQYFPWFFIVCIFSYISNNNQSVYLSQRRK